MKLIRDLRVLTWDNLAVDRAIAYLRDRGFADAQAFEEQTGLVVIGTRGSWLGNLTSFDMTKLRAKIRVFSKAPGCVTFDLDVNTFGQQITQWNIATWRLEIAEFHRVLRGLGHLEDVWLRFRRDTGSAGLRWTLTLMQGGQTLTDSWETEIKKLEEDD